MEDSRDAFNIPHDLRIFKEVFKCERATRENEFWKAYDLPKVSKIHCRFVPPQYDSNSLGVTPPPALNPAPAFVSPPAPEREGGVQRHRQTNEHSRKRIEGERTNALGGGKALPLFSLSFSLISLCRRVMIPPHFPLPTEVSKKKAGGIAPITDIKLVWL